MNVLVNAFSVNMLNGDNHAVDFCPISGEEAHRFLSGGFKSFIGHESTATLLSHQLGLDVEYIRQSYRFMPNDIVVLAQYTGPRLPDHAIQLTDGASIRWWQIRIMRRLSIFNEGLKHYAVHQYR